jgi:transcriptional regulator with XRE-family HTH domain
MVNHVSRRGTDNALSKLDDASVKMLREYREGGWSHKDLAALFSISESRSSEICRGIAYPDSPGPIENLKERPYTRSVMCTPRSIKVTPEVRARIIAMRAEKKSHREIAAATGLSKTTVGDVLRSERNGSL